MIFHRKNVEIGKNFTQCKQNQSIIVSTSLTSRYMHSKQALCISTSLMSHLQSFGIVSVRLCFSILMIMLQSQGLMQMVEV